MVRQSLKNSLKNNTGSEGKISRMRPCWVTITGTIIKFDDINEIQGIKTPDVPKNRFFVIQSEYDNIYEETDKEGVKYLSIPWTRKIWVKYEGNEQLWEHLVNLYKKDPAKVYSFEVRLSTFIGEETGQPYISYWLGDVYYQTHGS